MNSPFGFDLGNSGINGKLSFLRAFASFSKGGNGCGDVANNGGNLLRATFACIFLSVVLSGLCGCTLPNGQFQPARTQGQQQFGATQWDPYAQVDGGPDVVGSRPREFDRPAAEPVRSPGFRHTRWPF